MDNRLSLIRDSERMIKFYQLKLNTLNILERGYVYSFKSRYGNGNNYMGRVVAFSTNSVRFEVFTSSFSTNWLSKNFQTFYYDAFENLQQLKSKTDLILYMNWNWLSPDYLALLKGTSKLRLKF
jgi:hypothetical protein